MPRLGQAEGMGICGERGDAVFGPFKVGLPPCRFQVACVLTQQLPINLRMRFKGRVKAN